MINTSALSNIPASVRLVAALLRNMPLEEASTEYYSGDSSKRLLKAEEAWNAWLEKSFPCIKSAKLADEAAGVVIDLCESYEQAAFEKGMKAGARLTMELLGGCRMSC